jgi:hypothetical protein
MKFWLNFIKKLSRVSNPIIEQISKDKCIVSIPQKAISFILKIHIHIQIHTHSNFFDSENTYSHTQIYTHKHKFNWQLLQTGLLKEKRVMLQFKVNRHCKDSFSTFPICLELIITSHESIQNIKNKDFN